VNEEALAHWGAVVPKTNKQISIHYYTFQFLGWFPQIMNIFGMSDSAITRSDKIGLVMNLTLQSLLVIRMYSRV